MLEMLMIMSLKLWIRTKRSRRLRLSCWTKTSKQEISYTLYKIINNQLSFINIQLLNLSRLCSSYFSSLLSISSYMRI
jgi:hypothetical protein